MINLWPNRSIGNHALPENNHVATPDVAPLKQNFHKKRAASLSESAGPGNHHQRNKMKYSFLTHLLSAFILLFASTRSASADGVQDKVNWPEFLGRHDLLWNRIPRNWSEGVMLGNGQVGASIFGNEKVLRWNLHRQDVTDQRPFRADKWDSPLFDTCRLRLGAFELRPVGKVTGFEARLDLWNAIGTGVVTTDQGKITWRTFVQATQPLVIIEFSSEGAEDTFTWDWRPASTSSARWGGFENKQSRSQPDYAPNPDATTEKQGDVFLSVHPLNAGGHFAVAWREQRPTANRRIVVATIMPVSEHAKVDALKTINGMSETADSLFTSHRQTWHERYPASFVSVSDTRAESYYWINIYKLYSATRADQPPIDVHGMWLFDSSWANVWWNMNIQLAYCAQATANRLELAESLCRNLEKYAHNLSSNVPVAAWRNDSAWINRVSDQQLRSGAHPAWPHGFEMANLSWALEAFWRQCRWSGNDQRLREKCLPLLEKSLNTYRHILKEGSDGNLHLPLTVSPEYGKAEDCNYDLGALRWNLKTLIRESERLGVNAEKIPGWEELRKKLVDYPQGPEGLWIGANKKLESSHRHYSHLLAFYPLSVLDWDNVPDRDLIRRSVEHWYGLKDRLFGYSHTGAASMYAIMGCRENAMAALQTYLDKNATPNAFYNEGTLEVGFSFCQSVHDMLLQSRNGLIRVFPAAWDDAVFYNLRTEGAFLVSAARKKGKTTWVLVKSLAGEPCKVEVEGRIHELKLAKGEEAIVVDDGERLVLPVPSEPERENYYGSTRAVGK